MFYNAQPAQYNKLIEANLTLLSLSSGWYHVTQCTTFHIVLFDKRAEQAMRTYQHYKKCHRLALWGNQESLPKLNYCNSNFNYFSAVNDHSYRTQRTYK